MWASRSSSGRSSTSRTPRPTSCATRCRPWCVASALVRRDCGSNALWIVPRSQRVQGDHAWAPVEPRVRVRGRLQATNGVRPHLRLVDLASVVRKYIGETENTLAPLFTELHILTAQPPHLLSLLGRQAVRSDAPVSVGLADPVPGGLGRGARSHDTAPPAAVRNAPNRPSAVGTPGGYGGRDFDIVDSSRESAQVPIKPGQLHTRWIPSGLPRGNRHSRRTLSVGHPRLSPQRPS
jgi:hypothetical protein